MKNFGGSRYYEDSWVSIIAGLVGLIIWAATLVIAFINISPAINDAIDSGFVAFLLTAVLAVIAAKVVMLLYGLFLMILGAVLYAAFG